MVKITMGPLHYIFYRCGEKKTKKIYIYVYITFYCIVLLKYEDELTLSLICTVWQRKFQGPLRSRARAPPSKIVILQNIVYHYIMELSM